MKYNRKTNLRKITLAGTFTAIAVIGSLFQIPVLGSKCAPIQHLINILGAVFLGPWYAVGAAFAASMLRNLFGLGTLLAFPGSMCGAFLAGVLYRRWQKLPWAYLGELFGTGMIGSLLAFPVAKLLMGKEAALFGLVIPFLISSAGGTILAVMLTVSLQRAGIIKRMGRA